MTWTPRLHRLLVAFLPVAAAAAILLTGGDPLRAGQARAESAQLAGQLKSDAADQRLAALQKLAGMPEAARALADAILAATSSDDPRERAQAFVTAAEAKLDPARFLPKFAAALGDNAPLDDVTLGQLIAPAMAKYGAAALPHLESNLKRDNVRLRRNSLFCVYHLGKLAQPLVPLLMKRLEAATDHEEAKDYLGTLEGLGKVAAEAVPVIIPRLASEDFHSQYFACRALAAIGPPAKPAVAELIRLTREGVSSPRRHACLALGKIGPAVGEEGVRALVARLADGNQVVRRDAVIALGDLGPFAKAAVEPIREALQNRRFAPRAQAAFALWKIAQAPEAQGILLEELKDLDAPWEAVPGLVAIGPGVVGEVTEVLEHKAAICRLHAVETLGRLGPAAQAALPQLRQLADDPDQDVRDAAALAVKRIQQ